MACLLPTSCLPGPLSPPHLLSCVLGSLLRCFPWLTLGQAVSLFLHPPTSGRPPSPPIPTPWAPPAPSPPKAPPHPIRTGLLAASPLRPPSHPPTGLPATILLSDLDPYLPGPILANPGQAVLPSPSPWPKSPSIWWSWPSLSSMGCGAALPPPPSLPPQCCL